MIYHPLHFLLPSVLCVRLTETVRPFLLGRANRLGEPCFDALKGRFVAPRPSLCPCGFAGIAVACWRNRFGEFRHVGY